MHWNSHRQFLGWASNAIPELILSSWWRAYPVPGVILLVLGVALSWAGGVGRGGGGGGGVVRGDNVPSHGDHARKYWLALTAFLPFAQHTAKGMLDAFEARQCCRKRNKPKTWVFNAFLLLFVTQCKRRMFDVPRQSTLSQALMSFVSMPKTQLFKAFLPLAHHMQKYV